MDTDFHRYDEFPYLAAYRFLSMLSHSSTGLVVSLGKINNSRALSEFPRTAVRAGGNPALLGIQCMDPAFAGVTRLK
jgi:hypothetical protein